MDEVLRGNSVKNADIPKRLLTVAMVLIMAAFAAVMIMVGISNFMEADIFSGLIYSLMAVVDIALIAMGLRESAAKVTGKSKCNPSKKYVNARVNVG